ncbi:hypothetical protein BH11PSE6_BH11PSE6_16810 [soil metagenome]
MRECPYSGSDGGACWKMWDYLRAIGDYAYARLGERSPSGVSHPLSATRTRLLSCADQMHQKERRWCGAPPWRIQIALRVGPPVGQANTISSSTLFTPGAAQAAFSAIRRSFQPCTLPRSLTVLPSTLT